jgi:hypothetical protein
MQSTAKVIMLGLGDVAPESGEKIASKTKARGYREVAPGLALAARSGFRLVFQHLTATVKTVGADVVTQVRFAGGRLHGDTRHDQSIVRTVHAALGGRLFVLLDGHDGSLKANDAARFRQAQPQVDTLVGRKRRGNPLRSL